MILVLPGTKWLETLCCKIKEKNYEILLVSPEEHPYCESYADVFFRSDIFDIKEIVSFCKDYNIEAVISDECDIAVPVVAELGKRLQKKTLSQEMASLYTDKFLMREFSKTLGLILPEYKLCREMDDALNFWRQLKHNMIIKPLDSNASHGVFTIRSEQDLKNCFDKALAYSHIKKAVIAERYIDGPEFTVDGVKTPDKHFTLAISEKKHFDYNENIAYELFFTHKNPQYDYERLKAVNDLFINESGLKFGFTHAEYKYEDGKFYLIEIAARGGGNQISSIITQFMSGFDTYSYLIDCALGKFNNLDFYIPDSHRNKAAVLYFFHVPKGGGKVQNIKGIDILKKNPAILDYALNFDVGDEIHNALNDSVRIGYYIGGENSADQLRKLQEEISKNFCIEVT